MLSLPAPACAYAWLLLPSQPNPTLTRTIHHQPTGYVHQKEMFFSSLTAREHLVFHSINRLGGKYTKVRD